MKRFNFYLHTILILIFLAIPLSQAGNSGNCSDYAWSEKYGWISFSGAGAAVDYGVTVTSTTLSGYAWSEKTGWINLNDAGVLYGVANDGHGNLSGYAWSEKLGYISFDDSSANNFYQVVIDRYGQFTGFAWSEKVGYINMNDTLLFYGVTSSWLPPNLPLVSTLDYLISY